MYRKSHLPNMRILESILLEEFGKEEISEMSTNEVIYYINVVSGWHLRAVELIKKIRKNKYETRNILR